MSDSQAMPTKNDEPPKGKAQNLRTLWQFMKPYKGHLFFAAFS